MTNKKSNAKNILLVEGSSDIKFFEQLSKIYIPNIEIAVKSPDFFGEYNSKQGVFDSLKLFLKQMEDNTIERFAVIVDADYPGGNGSSGFDNTLKEVSEIVSVAGYCQTKNQDENLINTGIIFNNDDLRDEDHNPRNFGLWIMPNNQKSGMLEDFIKQCIQPSESDLMAQVESAVLSLKNPKYNLKTQTTKREIATWLAWQEKPDRGLYNVLIKNLLDQDNSQFKAFTHWLGCIYNPTITHQPI